MSSVFVIISEVRAEDPSQMPIIQYDDLIQTLSPYRAMNPLNVRVLPWRSTSRDNLFDAHVLDSVREVLPVDRIAIAKQKPRRFAVRKGLDNLLSSPFGRWMLGHIEVHHAPTMMAQHDKRVQDAERRCRHREEINANGVRHVVLEERSPSLRWWLARSNHVLVDGRFGHVVAEQLKLGPTRASPQ